MKANESEEKAVLKQRRIHMRTKCSVILNMRAKTGKFSVVFWLPVNCRGASIAEFQPSSQSVIS